MGEEKVENIERKIESPEMETPVRKQNNDTVSKFEESPVFNFINSLSPLKTVNSLRISQRFNSLSFPSVVSVFTSPQISSNKGAEVLKKHQVSDPAISSENQIKVYNFDEQKENYAVNTNNSSKYTIEPEQSGSGNMPSGRVQTENLSEETMRSDVSLTHDPSLKIDVSKNEEGTEGDWERLISNTSNFLIFDSPDNAYTNNGTSLNKFISSELPFGNTSASNGIERTKPPPKLIDIESFPNIHRGVRRRCLVYEMGGARKKQLEENSSSCPIKLSPNNPEAVSIDKQPNLPGIGLHLNALAKNSINNGLGQERLFSNDLSSSASHFSVGLGQYYFDQSSAVQNEVPVMDDPQHEFLCTAGEDSNQISPKKKRRKTENDGEDEECKRCNCKKSKCLKLYCECFAAGVYCTEPCSCQDCFNKPIHEETVLATRKQIESRNPLAFAPKVVRSSNSAPESGDDSSKTPASARHKRGCNCKKSGCLKKYCECYQEGVGCSFNCRCEGCKNAFGRKDGSMPEPEAQLKEEELETSEKITVDKSLHEYVIQNKSQQSGNDFFSATPHARPLVQLPFSYPKSPSSSSQAVGDSSNQIGNQNIENTRFLQSHFEFEKRIKVVDGDEIPEILQGKYSSLGLIKSSSPNRKRVSPPHCDSGGSPPERTVSRKLILQSIPSFPSLTPKQ